MSAEGFVSCNSGSSADLQCLHLGVSATTDNNWNRNMLFGPEAQRWDQ